jgi:tetratricopeptide (TPR) repeat protein
VLLLAFAATPATAAAPSGHQAPPHQAPPAETNALAEDVPADGDVEAHVARGHRLSKIGRYEDAIEEFRRAYELRAEPRLLYEIAEIYRRLGATEQARFYYERYLASAPAALDNALGAPDRQEVEAKLAALKAKPSAVAARPRLIPEPKLVAPPPAPPRAARPWRRWWFWTAIGVAVGAGATAIALSRRGETDVPTTALGDQKFFQ